MDENSPQITEQDVRKIAALAKLSLSSEEVSLYRSQLVKILDSIEELSRLDVANVPPTSSVLGLKNALREDKPAPFANARALIENAPKREGPYFKVPRIIEEE
jgi:aspartyl-tRNA(Asn)/glutamyl-tRNA(Gln) amidotransferase subunit C